MYEGQTGEILKGNTYYYFLQREQLERQTSSSRGHSTTGNSVGQHGGHLRYSSSNHSHISTHSSCMTRNQGPQIVDPYLDTITKETKARTRNRFSVSINSSKTAKNNSELQATTNK